MPEKSAPWYLNDEEWLPLLPSLRLLNEDPLSSEYEFSLSYAVIIKYSRMPVEQITLKSSNNTPFMYLIKISPFSLLFVFSYSSINS